MLLNLYQIVYPILNQNFFLEKKKKNVNRERDTLVGQKHTLRSGSSMCPHG